MRIGNGEGIGLAAGGRNAQAAEKQTGGNIACPRKTGCRQFTPSGGMPERGLHALRQFRRPSLALLHRTPSRVPMLRRITRMVARRRLMFKPFLPIGVNTSAAAWARASPNTSQTEGMHSRQKAGVCSGGQSHGCSRTTCSLLFGTSAFIFPPCKILGIHGFVA